MHRDCCAYHMVTMEGTRGCISFHDRKRGHLMSLASMKWLLANGTCYVEMVKSVLHSYAVSSEVMPTPKDP